ncbi:hypothetical protein [Rhizobium sp. CCGE 510]|uniref:hypothetical protein n=1 Tax=Rhizobium sp. CCGE 510 TaxID=1132836 RepID=UPI0012F6B68F|nr:hypothetical protein [Rhizobium sp. CCGE 510]
MARRYPPNLNSLLMAIKRNAQAHSTQFGTICQPPNTPQLRRRKNGPRIFRQFTIKHVKNHGHQSIKTIVSTIKENQPNNDV